MSRRSHGLPDGCSLKCLHESSLCVKVGASSLADFGTPLEFAPVNGHANEYDIRSQSPGLKGHSEHEMAPADWDKFEKDITEAFEQLP